MSEPEQLPLPGLRAAPQLRAIVRYSRRARRLSVRVQRDGNVIVVAPPRTSERRLRQFIADSDEWSARHVARALAARPPPLPFPPARLELTALGECWRVHVAGGDDRPSLHERGAGLLVVAGRWTRETLRELLLQWLRGRFGAWAQARLARYARAVGVEVTAVHVRRQRSRWGSCTAGGRISLNVALAFQRPAVADYLLVHELAHLRQMNHSARFWAIVAQHCPDWRRLDRELSQGWARVPEWLWE